MEWVARNFDIIVLPLLVSVFVPIIVVWIRHRQTFGDISASLSQGEAKFRADLMVRLADMQQKYDTLHEDYLESRKHIAALEVKVKELEQEKRRLKAELNEFSPGTP